MPPADTRVNPAVHSHYYEAAGSDAGARPKSGVTAIGPVTHPAIRSSCHVSTSAHSYSLEIALDAGQLEVVLPARSPAG